MIYTDKVFKLRVYPCTDYCSFNRPATEEEGVKSLLVDDAIVMPGCESNPDIYLIDSFNQVQRYFLPKRVACTVLMIVSWATLFVVTVAILKSIEYRQSIGWLALAAIIALLLSTVFTSSVICPIAHDIHGHWINLCTGATNLNGGCRLFRKDEV